MLCAEAGVSTRDFHENEIRDNWIQIEGKQRRDNTALFIMRRICYYSALYGNSDAKKLSKLSEERFMPLPGDKPEVEAQKKTGKQTYQEIKAEQERMMEEAKKKFAGKNKLPTEVLELMNAGKQ